MYSGVRDKFYPVLGVMANEMVVLLLFFCSIVVNVCDNLTIWIYYEDI